MNRLLGQIEKEKKLVPNHLHYLADKKEELEKLEIVNALKTSNNIKRDAAKLLGIPESTLRHKVKKLGIDLQ